MALLCREIDDWIEQQIEQPIEALERRLAERCRRQRCNWWVLCLNRLLCWLVWVLVTVVRIIFVTVVRHLIDVVCEVVSLFLNIVALVINLVLSIPVIGAYFRTIWNWALEIFWRLVGLLDFGLSLIGIRLRKRIYVGVIIPSRAGGPIATEAAILPQINQATALYDTLCNIKIVYAGACLPKGDAPDGALNINCDARGFFSDWGLGGSYYESASAFCAFSDGWRRLTGFGGEILVMVVANVGPDTGMFIRMGCSFSATHNYVVVEATPTTGISTTAHEMGHACLLCHVSDPNNLMFGGTIAPAPTLTNFQIAVIRWSRHCVYF